MLLRKVACAVGGPGGRKRAPLCALEISRPKSACFSQGRNYWPSTIHHPPRAERAMSMTPRQIVAELDRYIVGQDAAKRAVAVAIRNRWRRQQLPPDLRKDVTPKNIIMIGPTGVGKTEIARRLAQLVGAPFLKIEATKYTEVGYHGRDVDSMIRDLTEIAIGLVKQEPRKLVE